MSGTRTTIQLKIQPKADDRKSKIIFYIQKALRLRSTCYNKNMSMEDNYGLGAIISFVLGWLLAQGGKLIGDLVGKKGHMTIKDIIDCFTRSGGMPSGHTASFVGLSTYLGWRAGFDSGIFALAICTTIIVIYDAVNVRYAVGKQGELLNLMADDSNKDYKKLKVVKGHTVPQVIVGAIIGAIIGTIVSHLVQSA